VTGQPRRAPNVVAVGGGHGCARTLRALRRLGVSATAVVSVADDGGSSGRLRRDHQVVALGDLRAALLALAAPEPPGEAGDGAPGAILREVLGHRFGGGDLDGHSLGNLVLLARLEARAGDLIAALDDVGRLLGSAGRVLPSTTAGVTLVAETAGGEVRGQAAVAGTRRIRRVRLEPAEPDAPAEVLAAVAGADLVVLGPGSLFTSLLPNLLVPGLAAALAGASARTVLVANLREQPGETEGMSLRAHVEALAAHVPTLRIDTVLADPDSALGATGWTGGPPVQAVRLAGPRGISHDPQLLAGALADLLG
jgi:uncharacterized cofD-like protein